MCLPEVAGDLGGSIPRLLSYRRAIRSDSTFSRNTIRMISKQFGGLVNLSVTEA